MIVHLRERLGSGSIWVDGSRAYRTLDDYLLPQPACAAMRAEGRLGLAVAPAFRDWHADRRELLTRRMGEVEHAAAAGKLVDVVITGGGLTISPLRRSVPVEAEALKARLYALLPRVRITDLLVEVANWSGFADRFTHARGGDTATDQFALIGTILADATNLGLGRMAESSRGLTLARLRWTAEWHVRDETYLSALAAIVDEHSAHPLGAVWGPGDISSSDGQFFARAIFFNRLGELRDRTFENQRHRASGLTLVTAAVTMWNTVYLDRAVQHLRSTGVDVPNELLAHVAPLGWEHIGLTGDYLWSEVDKPRERFRPLRVATAERRR